MQTGDIAGFVGKHVDDLYGRDVGVVVGFTLKTSGEIESVGIDQGNGSFAEVKSGRLMFHEQRLVVAPSWKAEVMRVSGEAGVLRKRVSALKQLAKDSKRDSAAVTQYDQMRAQYEARLTKIQESLEKLLGEMNHRIAELDVQNQTLDRFLLTVSIQFKSGEIGEAAFGQVNEQCGGLKARNIREKEEVAAAYGMLIAKDEEPRQVEAPVVAAPAAN
jgi:CdvA-like coiled-coil domain